MPDQTPTTTIPRCWERPGVPGFHAWGSIGSCCSNWWVRRSEQDPRTALNCGGADTHGQHLWLRDDQRPPLPYTMWRCGGNLEH